MATHSVFLPPKSGRRAQKTRYSLWLQRRVDTSVTSNHARFTTWLMLYAFHHVTLDTVSNGSIQVLLSLIFFIDI